MKLINTSALTLALAFGNIGLALADGNHHTANPGVSFTGIGISSNQYLGLNVSIPANTTNTATCTVDVIRQLH